MMMRERTEDEIVEAAFAAARDAARQPPPADLMARVLADAERLAPPRPVARRAQPRRHSRLREFVALIGGWPSVGGLATATIAGFWIGVAPPAPLDGLDETLFGPVSVLDTALPSYDSSEFALE